MQSVKSNCVYLRLCCIVMAISWAHNFTQFSLIFSMLLLVLWCEANNPILLIIHLSQFFAKFHGIIKNPWKSANSVARL